MRDNTLWREGGEDWLLRSRATPVKNKSRTFGWVQTQAQVLANQLSSVYHTWELVMGLREQFKVIHIIEVWRSGVPVALVGRIHSHVQTGGFPGEMGIRAKQNSSGDKESPWKIPRRMGTGSLRQRAPGPGITNWVCQEEIRWPRQFRTEGWNLSSWSSVSIHSWDTLSYALRTI